MRINLVSPSFFSRVALAALACLATAAPASATILISEINSNAAVGGDFFELYNAGASAVDLTGWRWSDYDVRNWVGASSFDAATLEAGEVAVVGVGNNGTSPNPLFGSAAANSAFRTAWGLAPATKMLTWTGTGGGLGSGDGVVLFNASGNVATSLIYRISPSAATQEDLSTVPLSTFVKSFNPQPSANGHAGVMGGGTATESLVWDPTSGSVSPTYRNAVLGQWDAFANPTSGTTIGSPSLVPEPSTVGLGVAAGLGLAGLAARRKLRRA
jgi:hypothetical protein